MVHFEEPEVAKEFWHRAKAAALDDPVLLAEALAMGYQLGLDAEMRPLVERMQVYASKGEGPFKSFSLAEVQSFISERAENVDELNKIYDAGEIPLHLFSQWVRVSLAEILHGTPQQNRSELNPHHQLRVYTKYGGRSLQREIAESSQNWKLHLDITAILLAEDLGILEKVERCFRPLHISRYLQTALIAQRDSLRPYQQRRITAFQRIDDLLSSGKARLIPEEVDLYEKPDDLKKKMGSAWVATLLRADAENGFVVDYLPLTSNDAAHEQVILPGEFHNRVINCRAIVDSLRDNGPLSLTSFDQKIEALGHEGAKDLSPSIPPLGSKLFLTGNTASVLANAELLELVCNEFLVFIDPIYVQILRNSLRGQEYYSKLESWLSKLEDRIRAGLDNGVYECVSVSEEWLRKYPEREESDNLDFLALRELLLFTPRDGDTLWVDDRLLNSYAHRDGVPIIAIDEVLWVLYCRGELSNQEYYNCLFNLRSGNIRYIPLDSKEILYHLNQAHIQNGLVAETNELLVLRKYIADCLLDPERLQRPPMPEGSSNITGELPFVHGVINAIADSIISIWSDDKIDLESAEARANYLFNNFFTGIFGLRHLLPKFDPQNDGIDLIGLDVGGLFGKGFIVPGQVGPRDSSRRRQFFSWVEKVIARHRFKADPTVVISAADTLRTLIGVTTAKQVVESEDESLRRLIVQGFFLDLPSNLRDELKLDPEVMDWIGISLVDSVQFGDLVFSASDFWDAARKAIAGEIVSINSLEPGTEYSLTKKPRNNGDMTIEIQDPAGIVCESIGDPILGMLLQSPDDRESILREHRYWFDCKQTLFEKEMGEIVAFEDLSKRIKSVNYWRKKSAEVFYRRLQEQILNSRQFDWSDLLPPSAMGLIRHFRLEEAFPEGRDFHNLVSDAALMLIDEEGLDAALNRLACLPVRMPECIFEELGKLSENQSNTILEKFSSNCASPVGKLHLIDIGMRLASSGDGNKIQLSKAAITELFNQETGEAEFRLFKALLEFVNDEFGYWAETSKWSPAIKLAMVWAHASKLYNLFHKAEAIPDKLAEAFEGQDSPISVEILYREPEYWNDVLHPHRLNRKLFLTHAVSYVLSDKDLATLEDVKITDLIRGEAFSQSTEYKFPEMPLLLDTHLLTDKLDSFLGGDRGTLIGSVVGQDQASVLTSSNLKNNIKAALERLQQDINDYYAWVILRAVVGDLPVHLEFREDLKSILDNLDLVSIYQNNPGIGLQVLYIASGQLIYFDDEELHSRFIRNLIQIAQIERSKQEKDNAIESEDNAAVKERVNEWLNIALALSIRPGDSRSSSRAFGELMQKLIDVMPSIVEQAGHILLKLVFDLPVRQLHNLWSVVLLIRSLQREPL